MQNFAAKYHQKKSRRLQNHLVGYSQSDLKDPVSVLLLPPLKVKQETILVQNPNLKTNKNIQENNLDHLHFRPGK